MSRTPNAILWDEEKCRIGGLPKTIPSTAILYARRKASNYSELWTDTLHFDPPSFGRSKNGFNCSRRKLATERESRQRCRGGWSALQQLAKIRESLIRVMKGFQGARLVGEPAEGSRHYSDGPLGSTPEPWLLSGWRSASWAHTAPTDQPDKTKIPRAQYATIYRTRVLQRARPQFVLW